MVDIRECDVVCFSFVPKWRTKWRRIMFHMFCWGGWMCFEVGRDHCTWYVWEEEDLPKNPQNPHPKRPPAKRKGPRTTKIAGSGSFSSEYLGTAGGGASPGVSRRSRPGTRYENGYDVGRRSCCSSGHVPFSKVRTKERVQVHFKRFVASK